MNSTPAPDHRQVCPLQVQHRLEGQSRQMQPLKALHLKDKLKGDLQLLQPLQQLLWLLPAGVSHP